MSQKTSNLTVSRKGCFMSVQTKESIHPQSILAINSTYIICYYWKLSNKGYAWLQKNLKQCLLLISNKNIISILCIQQKQIKKIYSTLYKPSVSKGSKSWNTLLTSNILSIYRVVLTRTDKRKNYWTNYEHDYVSSIYILSKNLIKCILNNEKSIQKEKSLKPVTMPLLVPS